MSSSEVLEGKITRAGSVLPHTSKAGKDTTKQYITMDIKGVLTKITCYGMDDMTPYVDSIISMNNLKPLGTGYMAGYKTEIDDRLDSDPTEEHIEPGPGVKEVEELARMTTSSELSKYSITVTRSKDYQSITLSEEFTGSFSEIVHYWEELNKQALMLLGRMPKL